MLPNAKKNAYMVIAHNPKAFSPVLTKAEADEMYRLWKEAGIDCEVVEAEVGRALRREVTDPNQQNAPRIVH